MNELALFAGVGGGLLGTHLFGWRTIGAVEIEPYCREVLLQRQKDGMLPLFPIWDNIETFGGLRWKGVVDVITAGFPCQPFSVAGKGKGIEDERNMWPETIRVIREVGPRFALLENVPGLLTHQYFGTILGDLAESGYHARWTCLGADDVGANHRRKRLWILAYASVKRRQQITTSSHGDEKTNEGWTEKQANIFAGFCERRRNEDVAHAAKYDSVGLQGNAYEKPDRRNSWVESQRGGERQPTTETKQDVADANETRFQKPARSKFRSLSEQEKAIKGGEPCGRNATERRWWSTEPRLGRVAHGVAHRVDRLKAIGNGQVPAVVKAFWRLMA